MIIYCTLSFQYQKTTLARHMQQYIMVRISLNQATDPTQVSTVAATLLCFQSKILKNHSVTVDGNQQN